MAEEKPMSIERQMLLANFAAAALTGILSCRGTRTLTAGTVSASFDFAEAMLAEYEKKIAKKDSKK